MDYLILAINPGSTSTKIALYKNETELFAVSADHPSKEIEKFGSLLDQIPMRRAAVLDALEKHGYRPQDLSCVMGRGGLFPPLKTGGYIVNKKMLDMILYRRIPDHASNLGAVLADEIAGLAGVNAYIYDAVSASEFPPIAKITGMKEVERKSFCHVLNSRAVAIKYAENLGKRYEDLNMIVAHLGGGITMSAHQRGKIVESLADDNGPFAPERAGNVPLMDVIELCYSGKYTKDEMIKKVRGMGGLRDLLGTSDGREIEKMVAEGDQYATLVMEAQAYQIAKGIALVSPPLKGDIDAVILTGGLARDRFVVNRVEQYVSHMAGDFIVIPGEYEMEALALGGLRILRKQECVNEML